MELLGTVMDGGKTLPGSTCCASNGTSAMSELGWSSGSELEETTGGNWLNSGLSTLPGPSRPNSTTETL
ncbi:rho GTPase-activating protein 22-like protein [Anopheles sinensis]|uniref:Rho GTPase-activating protein 22-like protein n=1 Tax=Anopheles sinensis TaxID=74873 RepID=A0A084VI58_ANOSI|nr:rho GTPase-activating protein 22-like protein [Anopheles sinensis]